ncbi:DNA polymerase III subunit gamma/tau [Thalassotalea mangrovi]|uniref:DNA-directed DNA polymerase n=1 Tax=Thalassotalea mangrovi TaxID=2572245 RepID=A0A4V5NVW7_9GAMM|nr:DNA polymerase III subunit gamma/tau [Thalassotalea mangrovi]TKB43539.1 DNA polymerase III subunit gamma/tau [Thalassotalea mangrovi]
MSYQVLARKWRPKNFQQLMGQEHVVTVLVNAIEQQRLHHAYLFTGTRGVGKTTIARIFAKSLNCEQGITATPCGTCDACVDIDAGRFVDLLEIDAASRTKVDDTREILDNVQYAPSRGRYKVYLIDEVHMLSKSSFNALLKTLEEPPEHVKFILATTDPQKLPVTVLSRCLQFHLKALTPTQIETKLAEILAAEQVSYDDGSLALLSKAARGSMRDCLSLTDQAIAQGQGHLTVANLQQMLGGVDQNWIYKILIALVKQDSTGLMNLTKTIASYAPNYQRLLAELLQLLHQIAMWQLLPESVDVDKQRQNLLNKFSRAMSPDDVQLYYQIVLNGRRDLPFGYDEQAGFDMVVLRLLAFRPTQRQQVPEVSVHATDDVSDELTADVEPQDNQDSSVNAEVASVARDADAVEDNPELSVDNISGAEIPVENTTTSNQQHSSSVVEQAKKAAAMDDVSSVGTSGQDKVDTSSETVTETVDSDEGQQQIVAQISPAMSHAAATTETLDIEQQGLETMARDEGLWPQAQAVAATDSPHEPQQQLATVANMPPSPDSHSQSSAQSQQTAPVNSAVDSVLATRNMLRSRKKLVEGRAKKPQTNPAANNAAVQAESTENNEPISADIEQDLPARQLVERAQTQAKPKPENVTSNEAAKRVLNIDIENGYTPQLIDPTSIRDANQIDLWANTIDAMELGGRLRQLALNAVFGEECNEQVLHLILDSEFAHLQSDAAIAQLTKRYSLLKQQPVEVKIDVQDNVADTPFQIQCQINERRLQYAQQVINEDEFIRQLEQDFQAQVSISSIQAR